MLAVCAIVVISFMAVTKTFFTATEMNASFNNNRILDSPQKKKSKSGDRDLQTEAILPKINWLYSFPMSGTTYVMHIVQTCSNTSTATNYGTVMIDENGGLYGTENSVPVREEGQPGPAYTSLLPAPRKRVLTRTHSHGTCFECPPWKYMGPSAYLRHTHINNYATLIKNNVEETKKYSMSTVSNIVVLFRDPMDNVAARFFQKVQKEANDGDPEYEERYPKNVDGFKKYCDDMHRGEYRYKEFNWYSKAGFWEEAEPVPCRSEFVKIFYFYNFARLIALKYNLDMKIVTLKDFATNVDSTIDDVFEYLHLERIADAPENLLGDGEAQFLNFYTERERRAIASLGKKIALPAVWEGFAPYLEKYLPQQ